MTVTATKGQWFELPAFRAARVVQKNRNQGTAIAISDTIPTLSPYDENQDIFGILVQVGDAVEIDGVQQGSKVFVFASGEDAILSVNEIDSKTFPDGAFQGTRALTVQFYPEVNVKNGLQYYTRISWPLSDPISAGETKNIVFTTGAKKVLAKVRVVHYSAEEIELDIITGFTITTPGATRTPSNYNAVNPVPTTVSIQKDAVITGGTSIDEEPEYYFGSGSTAQRTGNSIPEGRERVLPENAQFAVTLKNTGGGNARVQYYLDWYEGEPDLPLP